MDFIPKSITRFLGEMESDNNILKLEDLVSRLESELRKIDAFKRELPLCMILINDAISALKDQLLLVYKKPVLEQFIPLTKTCDEPPKLDIDTSDKRNWLTSWNTNQKVQKIPQEQQNSGKEFIRYSRFPVEDKEEPLPHVSGLTLVTPGINNNNNTSSSSKVHSSDIIQIGRPQVQPPHLQASRKQRRCWSTELHRRFVNALQQLGGSKAATPKQIRELMRVDGLTNDEVKSHLQKYRLHTKRFNESSNSSGAVSRGLWAQAYVEKQLTSQSGSPDGPLLNCSTTGGDSMNDGEDEKSENNV